MSEIRSILLHLDASAVTRSSARAWKCLAVWRSTADQSNTSPP